MALKPNLMLALAVCALSVPATPQQTEMLRTLAKRVERLQSDLESIESVRAIKRVQLAYGHYVEFGLWNDFADLFTDDAVTNYQQGARGREAVRRLFLIRSVRGSSASPTAAFIRTSFFSR